MEIELRVPRLRRDAVMVAAPGYGSPSAGSGRSLAGECRRESVDAQMLGGCCRRSRWCRNWLQGTAGMTKNTTLPPASGCRCSTAPPRSS